MVEEGKSTFKCTTCQEELKVIVKLRVSAHSVKVSQTALLVGGNFENMLTPVFECPICHEQWQMRGKFVPLEVFKPTSETTLSVLTPDQFNIVKDFRERGLIDVFSRVVKEQFAQNGRTPKDFINHFLNFMAGVVRHNLPSELLYRFGEQFPPGPVQVWKAVGVAMIVSQGQVRCFLPMNELDQRRPGGLVQKPSRQECVRVTSKGMVPNGTPIFFAELQQSLGHCGREMRDVPLRPGNGHGNGQLHK